MHPNELMLYNDKNGKMKKQKTITQSIDAGLAGRIRCFESFITGIMGSHKADGKQGRVMIKFKVLKNHCAQYRVWKMDGGSEGGSGKQDVRTDEK